MIPGEALVFSPFWKVEKDVVGWQQRRIASGPTAENE